MTPLWRLFRSFRLSHGAGLRSNPRHRGFMHSHFQLRRISPYAKCKRHSGRQVPAAQDNESVRNIDRVATLARRGRASGTIETSRKRNRR
jgi:hypothetical protein